jgi:hypothetical protein
MIDAAKGAVVLSRGTVSGGLTRAAFLESPLAKGARLILENGEHRTWQLAQPLKASERVVEAQLHFLCERLQRLSVAVVDERFGSSWDDWSEAREHARQKEHTAWLRTMLGGGGPRWTLPWGDVESLYDQRAGGSSISITWADRLAAVLAHWSYERSPREVLALGEPALQRLLDGEQLPGGDADPRDFEDARQAAIAAFAAHDLTSLLAELHRRKWSALRIVLSGAARVADERIVELLVEVASLKDAFDRQRAVQHLGAQKGPRAIEALRRALTDRSSSVRSAAVEALQKLAKSGDAAARRALRSAAG